MRSLITSWDSSGWEHNGTGDRLSLFCPSLAAASQFLSLSVCDVYVPNGHGYRLEYQSIPIMRHVSIYCWADFGQIAFEVDDNILIHRDSQILHCEVDQIAHEGSEDFRVEQGSWITAAVRGDL